MQVEVAIVRVYKSHLRNVTGETREYILPEFSLKADQIITPKIVVGEIPEWIKVGYKITKTIHTLTVNFLTSQKPGIQELEDELNRIPIEAMSTYLNNYEIGYMYFSIVIAQTVDLVETELRDHKYHWVSDQKLRQIIMEWNTTTKTLVNAIELSFPYNLNQRIIDKVYFSSSGKTPFANYDLDVQVTPLYKNETYEVMLHQASYLSELSGHIQDTDLIQPSNRKIFISYAHVDKQYAEKLQKELINRGFNTWIDNQNLDYGNPSWSDEILSSIRASGVIIVLVTENSKISGWVKAETLLARTEGKHIFPIRIANDFILDTLPSYQMYDVSKDTLPSDDFFIELAKKMEK